MQAVQLRGKSQFPYMVDPNTSQQMGESDDIISYLYNEYGDGNVPLLLKLGPLTAISNGLALLPRYSPPTSQRILYVLPECINFSILLLAVSRPHWQSAQQRRFHCAIRLSSASALPA